MADDLQHYMEATSRLKEQLAQAQQETEKWHQATLRVDDNRLRAEQERDKARDDYADVLATLGQERDELREALERIERETGTSTAANHIARAALNSQEGSPDG